MVYPFRLIFKLYEAFDQGWALRWSRHGAELLVENRKVYEVGKFKLEASLKAFESRLSDAQ